MIDETDNGRRLAEEVALRVKERFPSFGIEFAPTSGSHGTLVVFTPTRGAPLWLYANFDWSFQLESEIIFFEDLPMDEPEPDRIARVVREITSIATQRDVSETRP